MGDGEEQDQTDTSQQRVHRKQLGEIVAKHVGVERERGRETDDQRHPARQKPQHGVIDPRQQLELPPIAGDGRPKLGIRERPTNGGQPANAPRQQDCRTRLKGRQHIPRRREDPHTNHVGHDQQGARNHTERARWIGGGVVRSRHAQSGTWKTRGPESPWGDVVPKISTVFHPGVKPTTHPAGAGGETGGGLFPSVMVWNFVRGPGPGRPARFLAMAPTSPVALRETGR